MSALSRDIRSTLSRIRNAGWPLEAYTVAELIRDRNPGENVAIEDIVDELLRGCDGISMIELQPPAHMEVVLV